jgi:hypothetical protein
VKYVFAVELIERGSVTKIWGQIVAESSKQAVEAVCRLPVKHWNDPRKIVSCHEYVARQLRPAIPGDVSKF